MSVCCIESIFKSFPNWCNPGLKSSDSIREALNCRRLDLSLLADKPYHRKLIMNFFTDDRIARSSG